MFDSIKAWLRSLGYAHEWYSYFVEYWIFRPIEGPARVARLNYIRRTLTID